MKLKLIVAAFGLVTSAIAGAESYQADVGLAAQRTDSDGINSDQKMYELTGQYFFNAVRTDNLPLAEAAYLGKNSNVFAGVDHIPKQNGHSDAQIYAAGAEFFIPENFLYVMAGGLHVDGSGDTYNDWFTTVGITPIDGLLVTTTYSHEEGYDANIHAKYVTAVGDQFVNLEAGVTDGDKDTEYVIGGDFYFDRTFSVGAEYSDSDDFGKSYTVRTTKFFTENISGSLAYTDADEENTTMLGVNFRF
jgi:hypothetical protein